MSRNHRSKSNHNQIQKKCSLRKNQLFGPWGPGAILPCPDGSSLMIAGLDEFPFQKDMNQVHDRRLASFIGVTRLLEPPTNEGTRIYAVRFPLWMYCPRCHTMYKSKPIETPIPRCGKPSCNHCKLVPERFVVACPNGHIDDLPLLELIHGEPVNPEEHVLVRKTRGGSGTLRDIYYYCEKCNKGIPLDTIASPGALEKYGYHCRGSRPWLEETPSSPCDAPTSDLRVIQRGGTNVWYSQTISSIYIPDTHRKAALDYAEAKYDYLTTISACGGEAFREVLSHEARRAGINTDELLAAFQSLQEDQGAQSTRSELAYKHEEYGVLSDPDRFKSDLESFEGSALPSSEYSSRLLKSAVESISLISTLKETKALIGFSRLYPNVKPGVSFDEQRSMLSRNRLDWALATQLTGEGVFLKLNEGLLDAWSSIPSVRKRTEQLESNLKHPANSFNAQEADGTLNPRYIALHTLAHILMLGITQECGYPTASVRERIYCNRSLDDPSDQSMNGILIYTASDDSEGSLGGLVRAGRPGIFERIFDKAISDARWCSSDPVCIESPGQGQGSCNLAACYSCALVPETSCENANKILDRAMLTGTLEDPSIGLFNFDGGPISNDSQMAVREPLSLLDDTDYSQTSVADICSSASYGIKPSEAEYISFLSDALSFKHIEHPAPNCIIGNQSIEIPATLGWAVARVALLSQEDVEDSGMSLEELRDAARGWDVYAIDDAPAPEELLNILENNCG